MKTENILFISKPPTKQAFTLVELIIVITILAILATIAFISFKNYAGNARDGNKLTTLSSIEKGLSLYQIKTGSYPTPDDIYGSGSYSGALLSQVGLVGSGVVQSISMNKIPKKPIVDFEYTYGLSNNKKYYQLGTVLENNETTFIPQTYANNYTSKVVGNYKGLYRFSTGGLNYIMNLPSLVFTQSGAQDFGNISNDPTFNPKFVINNGGNLVKPYDQSNNENIEGILLKLTGKPVKLIGVLVPTKEDWDSGSGILAQELGYSEDEIGHKIYGEKYYTDKNNLQPSAPTPIVYASCNLNGTTVEHGTSIPAYETTSVTFGNTCTSEQRSCDNGVLSGSFTNGSCSVDGATGTFTLSSTNVAFGTNVNISNNCSIAPTSYMSSNTSVATISGTTITTLSAGSTTITSVGGACSNNEGKDLTVIVPTCTSFTYSSWGACQSNNTQTRTILTKTPNGCTGGTPILSQSCVYSSMIAQNLCTVTGQIIYTNSSGIEIGRVNNTGGTISGNPGSLASTGYIVICSGNKSGYVLKSINEGATQVGINNTSYGNYYYQGNSCPTNYHIPTQAEWIGVITAWNGGNNGTNLSNVLKLPLAGGGSYSPHFGNQVHSVGTMGVYWTSSTGYYLAFYSNSVNHSSSGNYSGGGTIQNSVRCFKN